MACHHLPLLSCLDRHQFRPLQVRTARRKGIHPAIKTLSKTKLWQRKGGSG